MGVTKNHEEEYKQGTYSYFLQINITLIARYGENVEDTRDAIKENMNLLGSKYFIHEMFDLNRRYIRRSKLTKLKSQF